MRLRRSLRQTQVETRLRTMATPARRLRLARIPVMRLAAVRSPARSRRSDGFVPTTALRRTYGQPVKLTIHSVFPGLASRLRATCA